MKKFKLGIVLLSAIFIFGGCEKNKQDDVQQNVAVNHELGALMLPTDLYAKIPVAPAIHLKSVQTVVNLNTPPVGDQGGEGSCVAWGTTYAARSIMWGKDHSASWNQSVNIFSPEYVYNQIKAKGSCSSGSYTVDALNLLKAQGVCTWTMMPYTDVSCKTKPNATQTANAANYKTGGYTTVLVSADAIKNQLAIGKPVIVAGPVDRNFMYLTGATVLGQRSGSLGGHCYCVVGYDDTKGAFKIQNSWGTTWADSGFGWISYTSITSWWQEAYVLN